VTASTHPQQLVAFVGQPSDGYADERVRHRAQLDTVAAGIAQVIVADRLVRGVGVRPQGNALLGTAVMLLVLGGAICSTARSG
jgi:hypothetical protein